MGSRGPCVHEFLGPTRPQFPQVGAKLAPGTRGPIKGPNGPMGPKGPVEPIGTHGDPWGPMGTHGDLWGPMGIQGTHEPMGHMGPMASHGAPRDFSGHSFFR